MSLGSGRSKPGARPFLGPLVVPLSTPFWGRVPSGAFFFNGFGFPRALSGPPRAAPPRPGPPNPPTKIDRAEKQVGILIRTSLLEDLSFVGPGAQQEAWWFAMLAPD